MDKLLIVDGHNLLFQMFYGMPARIYGKNDKLVHGTIGFLGALLKIIKIVVPTNIIVIFDGENGNGRTEINPEYKANRIDYTDVEESDNPFSQLEDIMKSLEFINIKYYETIDGYEADDDIAGYVRMHSEMMKIFIVSNDTDFLQLVGKNVSLYVYRGKNSVIYDEAKVLERYGIESTFFADYKVLIGDNSDNLKGVPKVGPKTAAKLINQYGGVHDILEKLHEIKPPSIKLALTENSRKVISNLELIKLAKNSPLPYSINEIAYCHDNEKSATMKILRDIGVI